MASLRVSVALSSIAFLSVVLPIESKKDDAPLLNMKPHNYKDLPLWVQRQYPIAHHKGDSPIYLVLPDLENLDPMDFKNKGLMSSYKDLPSRNKPLLQEHEARKKVSDGLFPENYSDLEIEFDYSNDDGKPRDYDDDNWEKVPDDEDHNKGSSKNEAAQVWPKPEEYPPYKEIPKHPPPKFPDHQEIPKGLPPSFPDQKDVQINKVPGDSNNATEFLENEGLPDFTPEPGDKEVIDEQILDIAFKVSVKQEPGKSTAFVLQIIVH